MMSCAHTNSALVQKVNAHNPHGLAQLHPIVGHVLGAKDGLVSSVHAIQVPHFEVIFFATSGE